MTKVRNHHGSYSNHLSSVIRRYWKSIFSLFNNKRTNQHGVNYNFDHDHDLIINSDYITYHIIVKKKIKNSNGVHYVLFPLNFFYKKQLYIISRFIYLSRVDVINSFFYYRCNRMFGHWKFPTSIFLQEVYFMRAHRQWLIARLGVHLSQRPQF